LNNIKENVRALTKEISLITEYYNYTGGPNSIDVDTSSNIDEAKNVVNDINNYIKVAIAMGITNIEVPANSSSNTFSTANTDGSGSVGRTDYSNANVE
jgi:GTP cyclohydrolase III